MTKIPRFVKHSGPEIFKKSSPKNSWNQINQTFFSWNCIFGSFKLFPSSKFSFSPFLKWQNMDLGQRIFFREILGLDSFKFSGPLCYGERIPCEKSVIKSTLFEEWRGENWKETNLDTILSHHSLVKTVRNTFYKALDVPSTYFSSN